jgi:quinol monooxygenase YgiN
MIGVEILVSIQPEKRQEFLQTIEMFRSQQDRDKARINCSIFETVGTPNQFLWVEKWTDQKLLEDYMKTGRFKALLGAIQVLGELNNLHIAETKMLNDLPGCFHEFR